MTAAPSPRKKPTGTPEQRQAADPDHSVWVAASAGSGKTHVLVDRVIRLLLAGANPQSILCLTFTKAAAAEMSNRLFQRLGQWIALDDAALRTELANLGHAHADAALMAQARRLFAQALETPGGLKIQTIHAFCERLLQLFPVESGLSPGFRVMDDRQQQALVTDAFLAALSQEDESARAVWSFLDGGDVSSLDGLKDLAKPFFSGSSGMRQTLSDPQQARGVLALLADALGVRDDETAEDIIADMCAVDRKQYENAASAIAIMQPGENQSLISKLRELASNIPADRLLEKLFVFYLTTEGTPRKKLLPVSIARAEPAMEAWLQQEKDRVFDGFTRLALRQIHDGTRAVYEAMAGVLARVNAEKRRLGLYDFDDLIARTAQLLSSSVSAQWVLYKLDAGLNHILVDEAQDTSPAQWTIITALAEEFFAGSGRPLSVTRTVFAVGDRKQSIFSFQGADTRSFEQARLTFDRRLSDMQSRLHTIDLSVSFRSTATVLQAVDLVFAQNSRPRLGFGSNAELERDHQASRGETGVFELWPLIGPDEKEEADPWSAPVDRPPQNAPRRKLARQIAKTIASWIGKRKIVARGRTVAAGDILILVQRRNDFFSALIAELRRLNVPVAGADRLELNKSLIVSDLLALGQFMRLPQDDYALACVLKSPLMVAPLMDDQLLTLANGREQQSLWQRLQADAGQSPNVQQLLRLTQLAGAVGPHDVFAGVVQQQRRAILERLGSEAEDAASAFLDLAMGYELQHGISLSGFLDWFAAGDSTIKREMDKSAGEVRIMTVHGSKGLEAPIVFLADAADPPLSNRHGALVHVPDGEVAAGFPIFVGDTWVEPERIAGWKEARKTRELDERMRLLYVAMTRAADELYVCGCHGDRKPSDDCWYRQVENGFANSPGGTPLVSVIRPNIAEAVLAMGAEPVWTDGVDLQEAKASAVPDWALPVTADTEVPVIQAPQFRSVTGLAGNTDVADKQAAQSGLAVHKLLELLGEVPQAERLGVARQRAVKLGIAPKVAEALVDLLARPDLAEFFGDDAQSEVALRGQLGKTPVVGRIDKLVQRDGVISLLDYKTDRQVHHDLPDNHPYARQMALYAQLLQLAYPGQTVRAALLWTQTGALTWIPPEVLSRAIEQA